MSHLNRFGRKTARSTRQFFLSLAIMRATIVTSLLLSITPQAFAAKAYFAGGCFWCMEKPYEQLDGVHEAVSGFTGGQLPNPTYSGDHTGHYEAVEIDYDPSKISYDELLAVYWKNIDPFDDAGQFCDRGFSYRAAVFFSSEEERRLASQSKATLQSQLDSKGVNAAIVTPILPVTEFWPVEEYHQDYYKKNPIRYRFYRSGCGRDNSLKAVSEIFEKASADR